MFLKVHSDSQLAKLLERIADKPVIPTTEVQSTWLQKARGGGTTGLSGSKAAFLLDMVGEAVEGTYPAKPKTGVFYIPGLKDAYTAGIGAETPVTDEIKKLRKALAQAKANRHRVSYAILAPKQKKSPSVPKPTKNLRCPTFFPDPPVNGLGLGDRFVEPDWYSIMALALDHNKHVAIAGPPGPGKSTAPEEYFIRKGKPFVVVNGDGGMRRRDLEGTKEIDEAKSFFQAAEFANMAIHGGACVLNEVNAAEADAIMIINGVIETPHKITVNGTTYNTHPDFQLVVTYNPGLPGTKPLNPAFKDRFFPIKTGYITPVFLRKVLHVHGMPLTATYASTLINFATKCWASQAKGGMRYQLSPRRLFDVVFLVEYKKIGLKEAINLAVLGAVDGSADLVVLKSLLQEVCGDL